MRFLGALLVLAVASVHCATSPSSNVEEDQSVVTAPARDWSAHPAIVELDHAGQIYAVSDPHGEYESFSKLLVANHLIDVADPDPTKVKWTGGSVVLVVAGDMIDKGPESLQVLDLVRSLETAAAESGGRVIATMGNHEAEFMLDPLNHKATSTGEDKDGIDNELNASHIDPQSLVKGTDALGRGKWIANLPFAARVEKWFFSHGGNSQQLSVKDLESELEHSIDHHGYGDIDVTGPDSILEAKGWYGNPDDPGAGKKEADALGVDHLVFGHDPGAFGQHGSVLASRNGILVKIDTAMGLHESGGINRGFLLHISAGTAEVLDDQGHGKQLLSHDR